MSVPIPFFGTEDQRHNLYFGYVYWTPAPSWAVEAQMRYDNFRRDDTVSDPRPLHIKTWSLPVVLRYFSALGWFAQLGVTYVHQEVERFPFFGAPSAQKDQDPFLLVDSAIGYRLPGRHGLVSLEAHNLLDQGFKYQDDNFRTAEQRVAPFVPERTILARLTLTF